MLFNAEMINSFLEGFDRTSQISENEWRISHIQLGPGEESDDPSILFISRQNGETVHCQNGENRFDVQNAEIEEVFNTLAERMNYYSQWESRALQAVQGNVDSMKCIPMLAELFPAFDVNVVSPLGRFLYSTKRSEHYIDSSLISILRSIPACYTICLGIKGVTQIWEKEYYHQNLILGNIVLSDDTYFIFSVIERDHPITEVELHLARLAQSIFEKLEVTREQAGTFSPFESTLTSLLKGETVAETKIKNLEVLWDHKITDGACLVLIRNHENQKFGIKAMASSINDKIPSALAFTYEKQVVCLLPFSHLYRNVGILEKMTEDTRSEIIFSTSIDSWDDLEMMYRHVTMIRSRLEEEGRAERIIYCSDHMMDYYLWTLQDQGAGRIDYPDIVRLRALGDDDRFLDTFYCFLSNNCKMSATAKALHIHLSTLKYRMEKIYSTISMDIEDPNSRMSFLLAYELMKKSE